MYSIADMYDGIWSLTICPNGDILHVRTLIGSTYPQLYRSTDNGSTFNYWQDVDDLGHMFYAYDLFTYNKTVYILALDPTWSNDANLVARYDNGSTWAYFGNDIVPKFIHFTFALLTAWLIFSYLKIRINTVYALAGALFFLSLPVIVKLSITVYVDLGLIFFSTWSLICLLKWLDNDFKIHFLILAAISCGLALGTKYNGLITFRLEGIAGSISPSYDIPMGSIGEGLESQLQSE